MATVEATTQKVQRILASEFTNVMLIEDGFKLEHGSTVVRIQVREFGNDKDGNQSSVVTVSALIAREVKPSPEFYHWAAVDGRTRLIGGVTVFDGEDGKCLVLYDHALLGDYLDPAELGSAVAMVTLAADELDEVVHTRFGGKRYSDA